MQKRTCICNLLVARLFLCLVTLFSAFAFTLPVKAADTNVTIGVGDTILVVNGRTSPGALVTILDGNTVIGTVTADVLGNFTKTFPVFAPGIHQLGIYAADTSGRLTDKITQEINVVEHATTTTNVFLPTTVTVEPTAQVGDPIHLNGSTIPNATLTIKVDNNLTFQVTADASGNWSYDLPTGDLNAGQHSLFIVSSDSIGNQSYPTANYGFMLTAPPGQPPVPTIPGSGSQAPPAPVITDPKNGTSVTDRELEVRGTAQPGTRIDLFNGSRMIGSVFANAKGQWKLTITLSEAMYELRARACNGFICSGFSNTVIIYFLAPSGVGNLRAYLDIYTYFGQAGEPINPLLHIRGGLTPYTITVEWGDGAIDTFESSQLDISLGHVYKNGGHYDGQIVVQDSNGERYLLGFTANVASKIEFAYWWLLLLLLILLMLLYLLWRYERRRRRRKKAQ